MVKRYTLHGLLTIGVGCVNQEVRVPRIRVSFETPSAKAKVTEMPVCTPGFVSWRAQRNDLAGYALANPFGGWQPVVRCLAFRRELPRKTHPDLPKSSAPPCLGSVVLKGRKALAAMLFLKILLLEQKRTPTRTLLSRAPSHWSHFLILQHLNECSHCGCVSPSDVEIVVTSTY